MQNTQLPTLESWSTLSASERAQLLQRPVQKQSETLRTSVSEILDSVRFRGDEALLELTERFDGVKLKSLELESTVAKQLADSAPNNVKRAIDVAYNNIYKFHSVQKPVDQSIETIDGIQCSLRYTPLQKVGLYIPGGSASLPSTVLMLGVPAQLAQCDEVILMSPPNQDGQLSPAICYAAQKCGIDRIFLGGGAQAIAAMAFGTQSIPAVYKIYGPGNSFVTEAKQQVSQVAAGPAIDLPAGPSELLVIADESAEPAFIASDLLSQAEHGPDSQVVLVSSSCAIMEASLQEVESQLATLPRSSIASQAMANSRFILTSNIEETVEISEAYAPEHLSLQVAQPNSLLPKLRNAGSIFVGHYAPESGGDYATGTNHVLPTYGFAKNYSSLGLSDFYRRYTVQTLTPQGLNNIGQAVIDLAQEEALDAHSRAVSIRLESERFKQDLGSNS